MEIIQLKKLFIVKQIPLVHSMVTLHTDVGKWSAYYNWLVSKLNKQLFL